MAEERKTENAEEQSQPDAEQAGEAKPSGDESASQTGSDWPELEAYHEQLRAEHAAWAERVTSVQEQLASVQSALLDIAVQYHALGIEEDLERLNRRILGGSGMAQSLRLGYDLERYVALFWPVAGDPRPTMTRPENEGEYRVEVYLHLGPDGRGRIRVEGAKRLEAPLPTSRTRLRSVLLSAVQAPKLVDKPGTPSAEEETPAPPDASEPTQEEQRDEQRAESATPRPGDAAEQPPPDEQVIPLGPVEGTEPPPEKPRRRRKT